MIDKILWYIRAELFKKVACFQNEQKKNIPGIASGQNCSIMTS